MLVCRTFLAAYASSATGRILICCQNSFWIRYREHRYAALSRSQSRLCFLFREMSETRFAKLMMRWRERERVWKLMMRLEALHLGFQMLLLCKKWVVRKEEELSRLRQDSDSSSLFCCGRHGWRQQSGRMWREDRTVSTSFLLHRTVKLSSLSSGLFLLLFVSFVVVPQVFFVWKKWSSEVVVVIGRNICGTIATTLVCWMEMKQRKSSPGERTILAALVVEEEKSLPSFLMMWSTRGRSIWIEGNGLRN